MGGGGLLDGAATADAPGETCGSAGHDRPTANDWRLERQRRNREHVDDNLLGGRLSPFATGVAGVSDGDYSLQLNTNQFLHGGVHGLARIRRRSLLRLAAVRIQRRVRALHPVLADRIQRSLPAWLRGPQCAWVHEWILLSKQRRLPCPGRGSVRPHPSRPHRLRRHHGGHGPCGHLGHGHVLDGWFERSDAVSASGSVLGLAGVWHNAEYNIFGDGNGQEATFNANATLVVQLLMTALCRRPPLRRPSSRGASRANRAT